MEIPKERKCTKCGISKPLTEKFFDTLKENEYGLSNRCKDCRRVYVNLYRAKDVYKDLRFREQLRKYGATVEWYRDRLIEQNGLCTICQHLSRVQGIVQRLQVDHDHTCCDLYLESCGKCLRGLLCADCNIRLAPIEVLLKEFRNPEVSEVDLRNALSKDSWTHKALQYLKGYAK